MQPVGSQFSRIPDCKEPCPCHTWDTLLGADWLWLTAACQESVMNWRGSSASSASQTAIVCRQVSPTGRPIQEPRDHKWPTTGSGCWTQTLYYITCTNVTVNSSYPLAPFLKHKSPFYKTEPEVVRDERCWLNYHIMTFFFFFFLSSCSIGLGFAVKSSLVLVSIANFKKFNLFSVIENSQ